MKLSVMAIWLVTAMPVFGQGDILIKEQITVISSKADRSHESAVSQIKVITADEIERHQWKTVQEVLEYQAGITIVSNGGDGSLSRVFLRGAPSEHVLVLVDGAKRNDASGVSRAYDFAHQSTAGIERIEVLYGPQSVLYGSDAVSGVIHIISRHGHEQAQGHFALEASDEGAWRASTDWMAASEQNSLSFSVDQWQTDGVSAANDNFSDPLEDDGYDRSHIQVGVGHSRDRVKLGLDLNWLEGRMDLDSFGGSFGDDPDFRGAIRELSAAGFVEYQWSDRINSHVQANLGETRRRTRNPDSFEPTLESHNEYSGTNSEIGWRNVIQIDDTHRLLAGLEWEREAATGNDLFYFGETPFTSALDGEAETFASFAQLGGESKQGSYLAGVRWADHDQFGEALTYQAGASAVLPVIGTRVSAHLGTGFRAPSLYNLYSQYGNQELEAEKSTSWELGVQQHWEAQKLTADVRYHQARYKQLITFFFDANTFASYYINEDRAQISGLEASLEYQGRHLKIKAFVEDLDAHNGLDEKLLRRPERQFGLSLNGQILDRLHYFARWRHEGERDDITFDSTTFEQIRVQLAVIDLVDLGVRFRFNPRWSTHIRADNVLDDDQVRVVGYKNQGRRFFGGFTLQF